MQEQKRREKSLALELRARHLRLLKQRKAFEETFQVSLKKFYENAFTGFDLIAFDDWLRENVEAYDDCKESMQDFIARKYGENAAKMVESFIGAVP